MCHLYSAVSDRGTINILVRPREVAFVLADADKFREKDNSSLSSLQAIDGAFVIFELPHESVASS